MLIGSNGETNPFDLATLLVRFVLLLNLTLTVQMLSKVHDATHRWEHRRGHFHEIEPHFSGELQSFGRAHHSCREPCFFIRDQTHSLSSDFFVLSELFSYKFELGTGES